MTERRSERGWTHSKREHLANVLVVAMANKLARIAWAVLSSGNDTGP
ncbi:MAG TPA: hypothetical protein VHU44_03545 [Acidobacteriaceae bacterium]|nr:hypothetical protein [Acidobacteriaceae bacterium]